MALRKKPSERWTYLVPKWKKDVGPLTWSNGRTKKKQNHWGRKTLFSDSFPQTNFFLFLLLILHIPAEQVETDGRWTHVTADKVTGRQTWHLSSYLYTPSGSQQRKHWCQTGRSSTGCWTCCSTVVGLLSLQTQKTVNNISIHIPDLNYQKHVQHMTIYCT